MALMRFQLDLAIPENIYNAIPVSKKVAFRDMVRDFKALAIKINAGTSNEEMTVRAVWHKCFHDSGGACEQEKEI